MTSRRRAFTLMETVGVFVLLGILATIGGVTYRAVIANTGDSTSLQAARAVGQAQEASWRTYGRFTDASGMAALESSYEYVDGTLESTGPDVVSVHVDVSIPGEEVVGIAVRGESGQCYTLRQYQPRAARSLENSTGETDSACTGQAALSVEGEAW